MALIELAARGDNRPVQIKEISESTGMPRYFLAKLVQTLVKADILSSSKGRGGGLRFARPPSQISLAEVVRAIDGEGALQNCIFGLERCDRTPVADLATKDIPYYSPSNRFSSVSESGGVGVDKRFET